MTNEENGIRDELPKPSEWSCKVMVEGANGFQMELTGSGIHPSTIFEWARKMDQGLKAHGLKPVRAEVQEIAAATSVPSHTQTSHTDGGATGPVEIPGENGAPPRCSVHGPMKWLEGTSKKNGASYAFWACSDRNCRPAKAA